MHGSFKKIKQVLEKNVAVFNVVLKRITVNKRANQYNTVLAVIQSNGSIKSSPTLLPAFLPNIAPKIRIAH